METIYLNLDSVSATSTDPFSTTINFEQPLKIKEIELCSIELPNGIYNIRANYNTLTVIVDETIFSITLDEGNYTTATDTNSLLTSTNIFTAINYKINSKMQDIDSNTPNFSFYKNKCLITLPRAGTIQIVDTNLSKYLLGFSSNQSSGGSTKLMTGKNLINLSFDSYIFLYLKDLGSQVQSICGSFKIQLSSPFSSINYINEQTSYKQKITSNTNKTYAYFEIQFYDRLGYQITSNNGLHYSLTFRIILN
jgi:hypothetical protein